MPNTSNPNVSNPSISNGSNTWLTLLWVIVCAVLIIGLAYLFTKYVAGRGKIGMGAFGMARGTDQFKVLGRLALGKEQMLVLVQVGKRYFLLGVTASEISTLSELTEEEAGPWLAAQEQSAPPSFGEALRTVLQQKRQR